MRCKLCRWWWLQIISFAFTIITVTCNILAIPKIYWPTKTLRKCRAREGAKDSIETNMIEERERNTKWKPHEHCCHTLCFQYNLNIQVISFAFVYSWFSPVTHWFECMRAFEHRHRCVWASERGATGCDEC